MDFGGDAKPLGSSWVGEAGCAWRAWSAVSGYLLAEALQSRVDRQLAYVSGSGWGT